MICIDYWDIFTENEATQEKTANTTRFSYYNLGAVSASTVTSALALHKALLARRGMETFGNHHDLEGFVTSTQWI